MENRVGFPIEDKSPMIKKLVGEPIKDSTWDKRFNLAVVGLGLVVALYFGQGFLKSFGEFENERLARENHVPAVEQSYAGYIKLGAYHALDRLLHPGKYPVPNFNKQ